MIIPGEIDFFISKNYIVTIHNKNVKGINEFFNLCKKDGDSLLTYRFESSAVLLYEILEKIMLELYTLLDQNSLDMNELEDVIFEQKSKKSVSGILELQRNIINTRKIMLNHKNIIKKLTNQETGLVSDEEIKRYYIKLLEHSKRFWENLEIQKEMIEVLNSTNESLINYRTNDIMRTLTIFSVIVFPLTLLAAIFGMNTINGMPFVNSPNGFWIIMSFMGLGCTLMIIYFHKKKWF
jgi:magnesium transporter